MSNKTHTLTLQSEEAFTLYMALGIARQHFETEIERSHNPALEKDIETLRSLTQRVYKLINPDEPKPSANWQTCVLLLFES